MESRKKQFWNNAMFWGFILALASMILTTIFYATDNIFSSVLSKLEYLFFTIAIVMCALSFKKTLDENDEFSYGRALGLGVATSFCASLILALFTFVLYRYIDPDLISKMLLQFEEKFLEAGLDDEIVEQQIQMYEKVIQPAVMALSKIFNAVFIGLLISLVTSIFLKKKTTTGFDAAMNEIENED